MAGRGWGQICGGLALGRLKVERGWFWIRASALGRGWSWMWGRGSPWPLWLSRQGPLGAHRGHTSTGWAQGDQRVSGAWGQIEAP